MRLKLNGGAIFAPTVQHPSRDKIVRIEGTDVTNIFPLTRFHYSFSRLSKQETILGSLEHWIFTKSDPKKRLRSVRLERHTLSIIDVTERVIDSRFPLQWVGNCTTRVETRVACPVKK